MPIDDILPPQQMSPWWTVVGVLLIAALAAWVLVVLVHTRHRAPAAPAPRFVASTPGGDPFAELRATYLARVDGVAQDFRADRIDVRELHLRLSAIVREFAGLRSGVDTTVMTLTDIEKLTGAGRLANLIAHYYHPSFSEFSDDSGTESIDGARTVISTW